MLKTALCSYGMSGEVFHAPLIHFNPNLELSVVLERTHNKAIQRYPNIKTVRSFEEILSDKTIELVVVNTPNQLHYPMAKAALEAGKNVVVEKPFTLNSKQGEELIALANKKNLVLSVFHNKRFEADFRMIQEFVQNKSLGEITYFELHFDRYKPKIGVKKWKEENVEGAGILWDLGPHLIDQALLLFGAPSEIKSDLRIEREGGKVIDAFDLEFIYPDKKVKLSAGMLVENLGPKYILKGTIGEFVKWGNDPQEQMLKGGLTPADKNWAFDNTHQWGELTLNGEKPKRLEIPKSFFENYYQNVYAAIKGEGNLLVQAEQALDIIKTIEQILI
jgi:scyllo-inositol 2-dehydrogenase (NADP+)